MKLTGHKTEAVYRRYATTVSAILQGAVGKLKALHTAKSNNQSFVKVTPAPAVRQ